MAVLSLQKRLEFVDNASAKASSGWDTCMGKPMCKCVCSSVSHIHPLSHSFSLFSVTKQADRVLLCADGQSSWASSSLPSLSWPASTSPFAAYPAAAAAAFPVAGIAAGPSINMRIYILRLITPRRRLPTSPRIHRRDTQPAIRPHSMRSSNALEATIRSQRCRSGVRRRRRGFMGTNKMMR